MIFVDVAVQRVMCSTTTSTSAWMKTNVRIIPVGAAAHVSTLQEVTDVVVRTGTSSITNSIFASK